MQHPPPLPPSGIALLLRALCQRRARRARATAPTRYRIDRIDADHVRRYRAAFRFDGDAVPLTYLYLLAQRAQLATMRDRPIPFRIPGLVHVANRLMLHADIRLDAALTLTTTLTLSPPAANGAVRCVLSTQASDGARPAFTCDSTYLVERGVRPPRGASPPPAAATGHEIGRWQVAPDAGRRYAALSGDWNPIHLWSWSARLMGMPQAIIHGMHTAATCCALVQHRCGQPVTELDCRFQRPVPLGARAVLVEEAAQDRFTVICNDRPALECTIGLQTPLRA